MSNNMSSDPFVALFYQPHQITTTTQKPLIFKQKPVILEKIKETTQGPKETGLAEDEVTRITPFGSQQAQFFLPLARARNVRRDERETTNNRRLCACILRKKQDLLKYKDGNSEAVYFVFGFSSRNHLDSECPDLVLLLR